MRNFTFLLVLFFASTLYSQKIVEDKVDDFTKKKIVRTDWEKISGTTKLFLNTRITTIENTAYLDLKFFPKGVSSVDVNDDMSFMFDDGEVVHLRSTEYKISDYGEGSVGLVGSKALGLYIHCIIPDEKAEVFKTKLVKKIRLNKSEGYSEEEIKPKNAEKLKKMFQLIYK